MALHALVPRHGYRGALQLSSQWLRTDSTLRVMFIGTLLPVLHCQRAERQKADAVAGLMATRAVHRISQRSMRALHTKGLLRSVCVYGFAWTECCHRGPRQSTRGRLVLHGIFNQFWTLLRTPHRTTRCEVRQIIA